MGYFVTTNENTTPQMPFIILKNPFMRHYAGSVFDLDENHQRASWDVDERLYERMPMQRNYFLPDGGKGFALELPLSDTVLCPSSVIDGLDLTAGPCRVTSVQTTSVERVEVSKPFYLTLEQVQLSEDKQTISLPIFLSSHYIHIVDRKNKQLLDEIKVETQTIVLDFSSYRAGFYEIKIFSEQGIIHTLTCIKCFPLVVTFDSKTGTYTTTKTIW